MGVTKFRSSHAPEKWSQDTEKVLDWTLQNYNDSAHP